jgi:hypothetical protein
MAYFSLAAGGLRCLKDKFEFRPSAAAIAERLLQSRRSRKSPSYRKVAQQKCRGSGAKPMTILVRCQFWGSYLRTHPHRAARA